MNEFDFEHRDASKLRVYIYKKECNYLCPAPFVFHLLIGVFIICFHHHRHPSEFKVQDMNCE